MSRDVLPAGTTVAALAAGVAALGVIYGFRSVAGDVLFMAVAGSLWMTAWIATRWFEHRDGVERIVRAGVIAFAEIAACGLILGGLRLLTLPAVLIAQAALLAIVLALARSTASPVDREHTVYPIAAIAVGAAMFCFVVAMGIGHSPLTAYDSLSYHLFFPARWIQQHALAIVPTPFSDEAQAYQPAAGELFFAWLMLPFHGDLLARIGQVPFYALGACVTVMLARRAGAQPAHAAYGAAFFLIAPLIVEQATGANVDLICAVLFAASLALGMAAVESDARRDWFLWGLSAGLFFGSKYLALVYAPLLITVPLVRGIRTRAVWAAPGIAALGLPWYLRNWIVAGSPIYPSSLAIGGLTIARGAFSHAALTRSAFHTNDLRVLALSAFHAFGPTLLVLWLPVALFVAASVIARRGWWPAGFLVAVTLLSAPLCWIGVPDNADARFLLPGVVPAMALFALAFTARPIWNAVVTGVYWIGMAFVLKGAAGGLNVAAPWFMDGWLTWQGVLRSEFVTAFAIATAVGAGVYALVRRSAWRTAVMAMMGVAATVAMADGAEHWCPGTRCDYVRVESLHIRMGEIYAWRWLEAHVSGAHVAYTGDNLPYALSGHRLQNTVSYVNIDRHGGWRFDDYARSFRHRGGLAAGDVRLASASHVLDPLGPGESGDDAPRPRFERMSGDRASWTRNLARDGIGYLVVFVLNPYEAPYVWHDAGGFPIENAWASSDPGFSLVFDNPDARIYAVRAE
jgi:hypothetical protein